MRRRSFKVWIILFVSMLTSGWTVGLYAQTPEFKASASASKIVENSVFDIRFELSEAEGKNFQPPSFGDFRVVGGPARGSSTMIINGVVSRNESWSYSLLATRTGKFTIGPASVVAGRKKLTTRPVAIEVVKAKEIAPSEAGKSREGILLVAEIEDKKYYPGQQIILNYKILFRENVQTVNVLSEDDYADFFVQAFGMFSKEPTIETVNGLQYTSRIIKSIALYPHQSGTYTLDPMVMDVGINAPFPGIQGFFTMKRIQDVRVASSPLTLTVLPLPEGAPDSFNGAVGQYTMTTTAAQNQMTTDDALSFYVEIKGNGDSRRWDPPVAAVDSVFEIYDPKILEDRLEENAGTMMHTRRIEYQMLPRVGGEYAVIVPFTYFDPVAQRYITIYGDTISIQVAQGSSTSKRKQTDESEAPSVELMKYTTPLLSDRFWSSWPHLLLFGLIVSGSFWSMFVSYKRKREAHIPEWLRIKQEAVKNGLAQLDALEASSDTLTGRTFYEKATEILHRFLCARFSIPPAELDESRLPAFLEKEKIPSDEAGRIFTLFRESLVVRYGGIPSGYTREEMLAACRDRMEAVRQATGI